MEGFKIDIDKLIDGEYYWYDVGFGWCLGLIHIDDFDDEVWMERMGSDDIYRTFKHVVDFDYTPIKKKESLKRD